MFLLSGWWSRSGSNRRPQACKARALPTELRPPNDDRQWKSLQRRLVGPGRVERPTSRLSGVRSNHLSYEPETRAHGTRFQVHFAKTIAIGPAVSYAPSHTDESGQSTEKGRETKTAVLSPYVSSEMSRDDMSVVSKTSSLERR